MRGLVQRRATPRPYSAHRGALAARWGYSLMRWSCAGGMRGGAGERTSPPVTVS